MEITYQEYLEGLTWTDFTPDSPTLDPKDLKTGALQKDFWRFSSLFREVQKTFSSVDQLYERLEEIMGIIQKSKEKFRDRALNYSEYELEKNPRSGINGSYRLKKDGQIVYIAKPIDEDMGAIHSRTSPSPFLENPVRSNIPLYQSVMREVLAYKFAQILGIEHIVPKTSFGIIKSDQFVDFGDKVSIQEQERYRSHFPTPDREKLCSIQEYVHHSRTLAEALIEFQNQELSDEEIQMRFDMQDFEDANILVWTTYDTDAHLGNFLVYSKGVDPIGNEILGLKKIDNGFAFPEENTLFRNGLSYLPNANQPLSDRAKSKIAAIDTNALFEECKKMGLEEARFALIQRMHTLKRLSQKEGITIKEISKEMKKL